MAENEDSPPQQIPVHTSAYGADEDQMDKLRKIERQLDKLKPLAQQYDFTELFIHPAESDYRERQKPSIKIELGFKEEQDLSMGELTKIGRAFTNALGGIVVQCREFNEGLPDIMQEQKNKGAVTTHMLDITPGIHMGKGG